MYNNSMSLLNSPFIPAGMVELMTGLSKSIIKEKPQDIYEFAAEFFEKMLIERDGSLDKGYGKFRSYTEYCKFLDRMEQRRLKQPNTWDKGYNVKRSVEADLPDASTIIPKANFEIQGVAIQGVERKPKDNVKNVSINPKYRSQSGAERESVTKPIVASVKKPKPRKLSSKKPSENLIVIKEETSTDVDEGTNCNESTLHKSAVVIQKAVRKYLSRKGYQHEGHEEKMQLSEHAAAVIIQKAFKSLIEKLNSSSTNLVTAKVESTMENFIGQESSVKSDKDINDADENSLLIKTSSDNITRENEGSTGNPQESALDETTIKLVKELNQGKHNDTVDTVLRKSDGEVNQTQALDDVTPTEQASDNGLDFEDSIVSTADNTEMGLKQNKFDTEGKPTQLESERNQAAPDTSHNNEDNREMELSKQHEENISLNIEEEEKVKSELKQNQITEITASARNNNENDPQKETESKSKDNTVAVNTASPENEVFESKENQILDSGSHQMVDEEETELDTKQNQIIATVTHTNEDNSLQESESKENIIAVHAANLKDDQKIESESKQNQMIVGSHESDQNKVIDSVLEHNVAFPQNDSKIEIELEFASVSHHTEDDDEMDLKSKQNQETANALDDNEDRFKEIESKSKEILPAANSEDDQEEQLELTQNQITADQTEDAQTVELESKQKQSGEGEKTVSMVRGKSSENDHKMELETKPNQITPTDNEDAKIKDREPTSKDISRTPVDDKKVELESKQNQETSNNFVPHATEMKLDQDVALASSLHDKEDRPKMEIESQQNPITETNSGRIEIEKDLPSKKPIITANHANDQDTDPELKLNQLTSETSASDGIHSGSGETTGPLEDDSIQRQKSVSENNATPELDSATTQSDVAKHMVEVNINDVSQSTDSTSNDPPHPKIEADVQQCAVLTSTTIESTPVDRTENQTDGTITDTVNQPTIQHKEKEISSTNDRQVENHTLPQETEKNHFTVKNDEIYVNLDLLQEKLDKSFIEDIGSESEKSFKLNIHEREEILVNQENLNHIGDDQSLMVSKDQDNSDISEPPKVLDQENDYTESFENLENKDSKGKEDGGNEEYELAETVVLDDVSVNTINEKEMATTPNVESDTSDILNINNQTSNNQKSNVTNEPQEAVSNFEKIPNDLSNDSVEVQLDLLQPYNLKQQIQSPISKQNDLLSEKKKENFVGSQASEAVDILNEKTSESQTGSLQKDAITEEATEETPSKDIKVKDDLNPGAICENAKTPTDSTDVFITNASTNSNVNKIEINETKIMNERATENLNECLETDKMNPTKEELSNDTTSINLQDLEQVEESDDMPDLLQLLKSEENEKLSKAATAIQKVFRGYIVRKSKLAESNKNNNELTLAAALTIQKHVRGYLARRQLHQMKSHGVAHATSNRITEENTNEDAALRPKYSNRFLIPKDSFLERESFADDEDYAKACKELAATSIQKTYRGYRVRRSLKSEDNREMEESLKNANNNHTANLSPILNTNDENISKDLKNENQFSDVEQVKTVEKEAKRVITAVLSAASNVLPLETQQSQLPEQESEPPSRTINTTSNFKDIVTEKSPTNPINYQTTIPIERTLDDDSILGQVVHDNIHVEGQMQQKYKQMSFKDIAINPIEELSDASDQIDTSKVDLHHTNVVNTPLKKKSVNSVESTFDAVKSFSYEQLSSDLSDTDDIKRESYKESEMDETSRDERDDLSEVENFDLSSCGEDSLEAMYYSIRKNEIMLDKMQKHVAERRESKSEPLGCTGSDNSKVEFPERVTENLDEVMNQVFKSTESSSEYEGGRKDEGEDSTTLDIGLDDSSSINEDKEIETSRQIQDSEKLNIEHGDKSDSLKNADDRGINENPSNADYTESLDRKDLSHNGLNDQGQQSNISLSPTPSNTNRFIKSQSVTDDLMNPITFAMKRKQALLDQLHVRPHQLQENSSEDHDAFPDHLLSDIDLGNIQRKIFASSVSETDSDYIEPTINRRIVRDDFNISTALDHLSTDSDSTIVSAATKIQAGARGFLTRRRLRRTSAGGTSISFEKRYSFGNAAIDKSLEDLIKRQEQINLDGAALKIQQQFRKYCDRKKNLKKVSPIREQTLELSGSSSVEGDGKEIVGIRDVKVAQKKVNNNDKDAQNISKLKDDRQGNEQDVTHQLSFSDEEIGAVTSVKNTPVNQRRLTLQRGDAVHRNSKTDSPELVKQASLIGTTSNVDEKDCETGECNSTVINKTKKKVTPYINIQSLINRGIGPRQRSMPVQIDSELMRIIPKHLRKRVKSADMLKKKSY